MIIENVAYDIDTNVSTEKTQKMTVKQSGKLFTLLSNNLYSDKIGSIVRELSCNARDSHIEAGNEEPFEIHAPTKLDSMFRVKDYGTGMSKEDVISIFSCYGESTKGETNDFIGAYGIGSKSPFAYAESFSITSIYDKVKTSYSIYVDSEGFPAITEMFSIETDERNGFEIFFDVEENDHYSFAHAIDSFLKYFDFPVNYNGYVREPYVFSEDEFSYIDEYCAIKYSENYYSRDSYAYFAGLRYKLDMDYVIDNFIVYFKFDIGDVDVSLSRESISYTERTRELIKERVELCKKNIINYVEEKIKHFTHQLDLECWVYKNYGDSWLTNSVLGNDAFQYFSLDTNMMKYSKLRFYSAGKKIDHISFNKRNPKNIYIHTGKEKILAKQVNEIYSYNSNNIICVPNIKKKSDWVEIKSQLNQFRIDVDSKNLLHELSQDDIDELLSVKTARKQVVDEIVYYTTIESSYSVFKYSWTSEITDNTIEDIEKGDVIYALKYKENIVDIDNKENILFSKNNLGLVKQFCDNKRILCFTQNELRKAKKCEWFDKLIPLKEHVISVMKEYELKKDEYELSSYSFNKTYLVKRNSNMEDIEDELLKKYCVNKKTVLKYELRTFLTSDNWTGIKLDSYDIKKDINLLNDRYSFLDNVNIYGTTDKSLFTDIINLIYKRSLEND